MSEHLFRHQFGKFTAVDDDAKAIVASLAHDELVKLDLKRIRPRNEKQLRLYWKLIDTVVANSPREPTSQAIHFALKIRLGYCKSIVFRNGETHLMPLSIAIGKMKQEDFDRFFGDAIKYLVSDWLPGVTSESLKAEVLELVGS